MSDQVPQGMKFPRYAATTMQKIGDAGLNPFAAQLLAEAHADKPERFGDETVMLVAHAHDGTPVFMLLSTRQPTLDQFKDWPAAATPLPIEGNAVDLEMVMVPRSLLGQTAEALKLDVGIDEPARVFAVQCAAREALLAALERKHGMP